MVASSLPPRFPQPGVSSSRYRCLRHHEGLPYFAVVELSAEPTGGDSVVVEAYTYTNDRHRYREWELACSAGIVYVLARTPGRWKITVHEIVGIFVDTTATTVGYAAIRAMCQATGHTLADEEVALLETFVFGSRPVRFDAVPDFETIRWDI